MFIPNGAEGVSPPSDSRGPAGFNPEPGGGTSWTRGDRQTAMQAVMCYYQVIATGKRGGVRRAGDGLLMRSFLTRLRSPLLTGT